MERRQTSGDRDPPRRGGNQRVPVGPGTGGLFGHLSARSGRVPPTAAQRITGETRGEREEGKSAPEDFLAFAREKVKGYKRRGQIGTFRSYRTTCRKFTAFIKETYGREEVPFGALEAELFREFRTYCYEERRGSTSAVQCELSVLRTLVWHATKEGKLSVYPFEHIVTHSESSRKELLTPEEVEWIAELEIDEYSPAAEAWRWFLFAYYAGGMRFSDVATLQWQHIREGRSGRPRVCYKMKKTVDTVGVPLIPEAKEILARYEEGRRRRVVVSHLRGYRPRRRRGPAPPQVPAQFRGEPPPEGPGRASRNREAGHVPPLPQRGGVEALPERRRHLQGEQVPRPQQRGADAGLY